MKSSGRLTWAKAPSARPCGAATNFCTKASLLIPAELARRGPAKISGTPANRHRALKTREAHYERERWLETVWNAAKVTSLLAPLRPREVWENPETHQWELKHPADYQLEREFAPAEFRAEPQNRGRRKKLFIPTAALKMMVPLPTPPRILIFATPPVCCG